jgi:glycosyltransferase involved in cell wall biosynthesis
MEKSRKNTRVLIVADSVSRQFGGEAALPFHYFRVLRARGAEVWLLTHSRVRPEIEQTWPGDLDRVHFVEDSILQQTLWRLGARLPGSISYITTGFLSRLITQVCQRKLARQMVDKLAIDVVHQPTPVSPKEPSAFFNLGAPVVIGPMNGGMTYPPGFLAEHKSFGETVLRCVKTVAKALNFAVPGKRRATTLLVANERTRLALPAGLCQNVKTVVENGVDLSLWAPEGRSTNASTRSRPFTFAFVGRLIPLKRVDIILRALAAMDSCTSAEMLIVGEGPERHALESLAARLGIETSVHFAGWQTQVAMARLLADTDCLLMPSIRECGGAVVLEAMAASKPVIATRWGGPADYIDASCGVLIEPMNEGQMAQDFAQAMDHMVSNPSHARSLGVAGRARVELEFDWERKLDRMEHIYEDAIALNKAPAKPESPPG